MAASRSWTRLGAAARTLFKIAVALATLLLVLELTSRAIVFGPKGLDPRRMGILHRPVDVGGRAERLRGDHLRLGSSQEAHDVDHVAARVHEGAAAEVVAVADVTRQRVRDAEVRLDVTQRAELPSGDDLAHARGERVVPPVEGLCEDEPVFRAASAIRSASSAFEAKGFSQSTCFPASSARIVHSQWSPFGSGL